MSGVHGMEPGKRVALLVVEVQNGITNPAYEDSPLAHQVAARGIVGRINELAAVCREVNVPVVFCTIAAASPDWSGFRVNCALAARIRRKGKLISGTRYAAIHDDLVVAPSDIVCERSNGMAPFTRSTLDATLRGLDIETVVLTGVSTNIALPGAATEAVALGYSVVMAEDCTSGATPETHQAQITMHLPLLATVRPAEEIIEALRAAGASRPPR